MRSLVKVLFWGSLFLMAVAFWHRNELPSPERRTGQMYEEPLQKLVRARPVEVTVNAVQYSIQPRYTYELAGLVVALHDSETWWDYAHREWNDYLNVVDLCVVWGSNAPSGNYRHASFWHSQWECFASWRGPEGELALGEMSNNHIPPAISAKTALTS